MFFFFQAEDGIRELVRSRGLGDVLRDRGSTEVRTAPKGKPEELTERKVPRQDDSEVCLLYTSDDADERSSVDLGGRRVIQKKKKKR